MRVALIWAVRSYQTLVSPALPRSCKYHPSCSQYAIDAVTQYGAMRGLVLAVWRLMRCNPLSYGGYDPVERQRLFKPRPASAKVEEGFGAEFTCNDTSLHIMNRGTESYQQDEDLSSRGAMSRSGLLVRSRVMGQ
jgi:uncharacterized protein